MHSQGPTFLQPGQLGDQIPMDVSRDRQQGNTSRQQSISAERSQSAPDVDREQAVHRSDAIVSMSRPAAGMHSIEIASPYLPHLPLNNVQIICLCWICPSCLWASQRRLECDTSLSMFLSCVACATLSWLFLCFLQKLHLERSSMHREQ